jgi:DNA-binding beta-propeller fold protein YncE
MTNLDAAPPVAPETRTPLSHSEGDVAGVTGVAAPTGMKNKKRKIAALVSLLVILALLFVWYLMNRKPLSELPGLSSTTLPHYELSIYGTSKPLGVAVTPSGDRIYVTESDGTRVVKVFDHAGKQTGILTPPASTGVGPGTHLPMYVAIDPTTQNVYVSDRLTSSIYVYDAKGQFLRTFAPKGNLGGKWNPLGLAFAPDGTFYVTDVRGEDSKNHRVVVFGSDGTLVRTLGKAGQLNFPNGIVVDSHSNIEVSDSNNGRLVVFNVAGKMLATISPGIGEGDLGLPRGAAVDDSGRLFVADTSDHQVRVYKIGNANAPTPSYIGSFGEEGQLDGTFEYPNGVATDKRAHIYITDRENNRVQVWGY